MTASLFALLANLSFGTASLMFASFAKRIGALRMNWFKASVAALLFPALSLIVSPTSLFEISPDSALRLMTSGVIGLALGDLFLLKAFGLIGPSPVLMLFGFQPLLLGLASYFFFSTSFSWPLVLGVLLLILSLAIFLSERKIDITDSKTLWKGLLFGLVGIGLDAIGVTLTKSAFEMDSNLTSFSANSVRSVSAALGLGLILLLSKNKRPSHLESFKTLKRKELSFLVFGSALGTVVSLGLYLQAVNLGRLSAVSAIACTGPIFTHLIESAVKRKWPSARALLSLFIFAIGFVVVTLSQDP